MFCYREFLHPDLNLVCFLLGSFLYIKLNKGELNMEDNRIIYDVDDLIFGNEEAYVSER